MAPFSYALSYCKWNFRFYVLDSAILPFDFEDWVNTTINDFVVVEEWSDVLENSLNITLGE